MKKENKDLLLRDLCARLPYGVKVQIIKNYQLGTYTLYPSDIDSFKHNFQDIKPYLRPMSSMTEKEKEDLLNYVVGKKGVKYFQVLTDGSIDSMDAKVQDAGRLSLHWVNFDKDTTSRYTDWLNAHHFDYRGLIEKGLALEAPKNMYNEIKEEKK